MTRKDRRKVDIAKVMARLRTMHEVEQAPLNVDTDSRKGYKSRTATQFCSDPIEDWTCPQCMKEYNGYGRTVVFPCWVCRDKRSLESFGELHQEMMPEARWSITFTEQEQLNAEERAFRIATRGERLDRALKETSRDLRDLREAGGASVKKIKTIQAKRNRIIEAHEKLESEIGGRTKPSRLGLVVRGVLDD